MCQPKSAIVLKDRIYCPLDEDGHSTMLEKLGIKDDNSFPNFVRIECVPIDGDLFNHDLSNWRLNVDQDFKPEWFDRESAEQMMKEHYLPEWFEKCFVINKEVEEIKEGKWYLKNGILQKLSGNAVLEQMWESSTVKQMWGSSTVKQMWGSSTVNEMRGSSTARKFEWNKKTQIFVPKGSFEILEK